MTWVRLGVLALRAGGVVALGAAAAWGCVVAAGPAYLVLAGALSLAWSVLVVAIAVVVGLRRRPIVGVLGILAGAWVAVFAFALATRPVAQTPVAFGNFWFAMGSVGILVAGLSGVASSVPLRWFGRVFAILWLVGSILSIGGDQFRVPIETLGEQGLRTVAIQWLGLVAFGVWGLWSARWLPTDVKLDWSRPSSVDLPTNQELQTAWAPYGPWPRRLSRISASLGVLASVPLAMDRFAHVADLAVDRFEVGLGLSLAAFVFVIGRTTPRLGHTRFDLFAAVPHLVLLFGFTEAGVLGGLGIVADGVLDGVFDGKRNDVLILFAPAVVGLWALWAAYRQRRRPRGLGVLGGAGLLVSGLVGMVATELGDPVVLPGIVTSACLALVAVWIWELGSTLVPGVARPATVFALPGLSEAPSPIPVVREPQHVSFAAGGAMDRQAFDELFRSSLIAAVEQEVPGLEVLPANMRIELHGAGYGGWIDRCR